MQNTSKRFVINWVDVWKATRTALVVALASVVLWFISDIQPQLIEKIPEQYGILLPVVTLLTELIRRWAMNYQK